MRRKFLFLFLAVLILGLVGWQVQTRYQAQKEQIKTASVKRGDLAQIISASGKIKSDKTIELKFQTSGQLVWVGVKVGDEVNPWQAIAQLDARELELNLKKALRDYSKERWDFEEDIKVTYKDKVITDTIKRILEKNQFDLNKAVADVEIKDIALKLATLVTSIGGIVTRIDTPVAGVNITPATAVFEVADPGELIFNVEVDETDIGKVKIGQQVKTALDAYPDEEFVGTVNKIAFTSTTTSGGGTAFLVEVKLPENENLRFKIGMNGDVEIIIQEKKNVLIVPTTAIYRQKDETFVYVWDGNRKQRQNVKIGLETDDGVEIIDGLGGDEKVVLKTQGKTK